MSQQTCRVAIAGTGSFLPNSPVPSDRIDDILGPLNEAPRSVRAFIEGGGGALLEQGGIAHRHFAIDPETRKLTHTFASLAEEAARPALEAAQMAPSEIEFLLLSSPFYDYGTPPTSTILQERLGIENCAEMEIHSNCAGVGKCMQVAFDALRTGRYKTALVTYSQLSSVFLRSCFFNQAKLTKTQAALRYILADGSGAVVLKAVGDDAAGTVPGEVLGTYVESIGGKLTPAMTAGGGAADLVDFDPLSTVVCEKGLHHLSQDFTSVTRYAAQRLLEGTLRMMESVGVDRKDVTAYLGSIPTRKLYDDHLELFMNHYEARPEQLPFRTCDTGYCGGATILIHFDEMVRSGQLKAGDVVVAHSVESSKWMSAGFVVRW